MPLFDLRPRYCALAFNAGNDAVYQPLVLHMLLASLHHVVTSAFKDIINLKSLHPGQKLEFKVQHHCRVK
jgi:hypothetical protein